MIKKILVLTILISFHPVFAYKGYVDPSKRSKKGLLEEVPAEIKKKVKSEGREVSKKLTKREKRIRKVCSCHVLKLMSTYTDRTCKEAKKKSATEDNCYYMYKGYNSYFVKAKKAAGKLSAKYDVEVEDDCEEFEDDFPKNKKYRKMKKILRNWVEERCDPDIILGN